MFDNFGMDKKSQVQQEALAGIEIATRKIEAQTVDLHRMTSDNQDLNEQIKIEKDKNSKLIQIAEKKYNIQLSHLDHYLPRGKDFYDKLHNLEKKMLQDLKREKAELRTMQKSKSMNLETSSKNLSLRQERLDIMRAKLKKRAMDA